MQMPQPEASSESASVDQVSNRSARISLLINTTLEEVDEDANCVPQPLVTKQKKKAIKH